MYYESVCSSPHAVRQPIFYALFSHITISNFQFPPPHTHRLSTSLRAGDLATHMIQLIPSRRISALDALEHEYFSLFPKFVNTIPDSKSVTTLSLFIHVQYVQ